MSIRTIFNIAQRGHVPVFQFNFSDVSQLKGIINGMKKFKKPFILGTSEGESRFLGLDFVVAMKKEIEKELGFPVILNLDHGKSFDYLKKAINAGYQMVHFDGSSLPFKENIKITKKVVRYAKRKRVLVEGEIGLLRGGSGFHQEIAKVELGDMTSPEEAKRFIKETNIDALAPVFGNIHGVYKKMPSLDLERLSMIKRRVGKRVFLVLHGGSGIPSYQVKEAVKRGIVKININTEIRIAWRRALDKILKEKLREVTPYKLMPSVVRAVEKIIDRKMRLFYKDYSRF